MNEYIRGFVLVYLGLIVLAEVWKRIRSYFYTYKNKHYFITGGSEGLGRSLARLIALKGGKVTIAARYMEKLKQVKNEIEDEFKKNKKGDCHVCAIQCDVIDESSVHQAVVKSIRQHSLLHQLTGRRHRLKYFAPIKLILILFRSVSSSKAKKKLQKKSL